ncbi:hypothetical protein L484_003954 [Morus notabilis]|uniref:Uncharacterized protein n=1 Tax=Morus notabilis TaxID=981085 RepID=W9RRR8_9ROSA|nr:hypothetical protein L484_003954 [Morus notabilis]
MEQTSNHSILYKMVALSVTGMEEEAWQVEFGAASRCFLWLWAYVGSRQELVRWLLTASTGQHLGLLDDGCEAFGGGGGSSHMGAARWCCTAAIWACRRCFSIDSSQFFK